MGSAEFIEAISENARVVSVHHHWFEPTTLVDLTSPQIRRLARYPGATTAEKCTCGIMWAGGDYWSRNGAYIGKDDE